jgi:hypothetical protein
MLMNSLALNMPKELVITIVAKKPHYLCLSMFANISCIISSTFEDEELFNPQVLDVSFVKLEPCLEDEATISK